MLFNININILITIKVIFCVLINVFNVLII